MTILGSKFYKADEVIEEKSKANFRTEPTEFTEVKINSSFQFSIVMIGLLIIHEVNCASTSEKIKTIFI